MGCFHGVIAGNDAERARIRARPSSSSDAAARSATRSSRRIRGRVLCEPPRMIDCGVQLVSRIRPPSAASRSSRNDRIGDLVGVAHAPRGQPSRKHVSPAHRRPGPHPLFPVRPGPAATTTRHAGRVGARQRRRTGSQRCRIDGHEPPESAAVAIRRIVLAILGGRLDPATRSRSANLRRNPACQNRSRPQRAPESPPAGGGARSADHRQRRVELPCAWP